VKLDDTVHVDLRAMSSNGFDLVVIGGGAAGFFGAIRAAEMNDGIKICILEKTTKLLSKVRVSGGGRCNVTHHEFNPTGLASHYPRGEKLLRTLFKKFQAKDTVQWFEANEVSLKTEDDGRMFPTTDTSQTIIDCFVTKAIRHKIKIEMGRNVTDIKFGDDAFTVSSADAFSVHSKKILIATGGSPSINSYDFISALGHTIIQPIPSLFTFNDPGKKFNDLMGLSVNDAEVRIAKTKFSNRGPVLITHWGLSGPAIIRLSAWAAEYLHQQKYDFTVHVNWTGTWTEEKIQEFFRAHKSERGKQRLWTRLCELAEVPGEKIWAEMPQRNINKLTENLIRCPFQIKGKTTFKEEFVTCGGVDLKDVDMTTMESRKQKNLFFAGEVLNIDGETGGFNFQSAWTTANTAAANMSF
jgi:predicted Rossmann fold flavoprotein